MSLFNLNNQQVARLTSKTVYKNLYQDIIHKDGFGITDRFVTPEQTKAAMIDIFVPIPIGGRFRMRGASSNGEWANTNNAPNANKQRNHVLSRRFTIDILKRYDFNIAVSEDEIEMTGAASLNESFEQICREQIEQDIAININGYTFAAQVFAFFTESFAAAYAKGSSAAATDITDAEVKAALEKYTYDSTNKTGAIRAFKISNAKVSKGDSKLYADYFPADARQAFMFDPIYLVDLSETASMSASDVATRMLAGGGMNAFTSEKKTVADFQKGYVGWLDGMPLYEVSQQVKNAAWYYLGLDDTDDATVIGYLNDIQAMIAPANATIRGLRPTSFKTVDDPDTQGVIIQPKVNMGVRCLSGTALKCVVSGTEWTGTTTNVDNAKTTIVAILKAINMVLPNLSYDNDNKVAQASTLTSKADGTQTLA